MVLPRPIPYYRDIVLKGVHIQCHEFHESRPDRLYNPKPQQSHIASEHHLHMVSHRSGPASLQPCDFDRNLTGFEDSRPMPVIDPESADCRPPCPFLDRRS